MKGSTKRRAIPQVLAAMLVAAALQVGFSSVAYAATNIAKDTFSRSSSPADWGVASGAGGRSRPAKW